MKVELQNVALSKLHLNTGQIPDVPKNPRFIKDEKFESLKRSIEEFPEMLELREIIAYDNGGELVIVGGNMRYRAMKELGIKEVAVAGGVSANTGLRNAFLDHAKRYRWNVYIPKFGYTTDNAAMIAITGYYKFMDNDFCSIDKPAYSRVSIG